MKRRFRLTRSIDFKRVRNFGKSYMHPLVVLYVTSSVEPGIRVGVMATRAVGNAVLRNRAKRLLRAAMSDLILNTVPKGDILLVARSRLPFANFSKTRTAITSLLKRANLLSSIP